MTSMLRQGSRFLGAAFLFAAFACWFPGLQGSTALGQGAQDTAPPKVILLGFDGVDFRLAERFIAEGRLPHLAEIKKAGTLAPLQTTNPAQSPVAWATIVTGTNPGKTNIGGFIRRNFSGGRILPQMATVEENYQGDTHTIPYSEVSWLNHESKGKWLGIFAVCFFLAGLLILKVLLKLGVVLSLCGSGVLTAGAVFFGISFFGDLPEKVPFPYNLQQGKNFWDILGDRGFRTIGLYAPGAYPVVASGEADILGGLGVPDINGGPGTWYVYSSEALVFFDMKTNTGGKVVRLSEEGSDKLYGKLYGPTNFFQMQAFEKQIEKLKKRKEGSRLTAAEQDAVDSEIEEEESRFRSWKREEDQKKATQDFWVYPDFTHRKVVMELAGQKQEVKEGEWSDWFKVNFELSKFLKVPALVRLRLITCRDGEVRFFVPAIDISPEAPPPYLRISSPADYSAEMAKALGPFETVGWSCITHGLKDEEIDEDVFLEDIEFTMETRRKLFLHQLSRNDWNMFIEIFYSTDRVQHMMYRLFDEAHPQFDRKLADQEVTFFGSKVRLQDTIPASYEAMDRIVGELLDRIKKGQVDPNAIVMIVSDHGFAPFYHSFGINNFLIEKGFMVPVKDDEGQARTVAALKDSGQDNYLGYVDWTETKAYSLGLGKIFINLKGREPDGAVNPADYDSVRNEIIEALEAYVDPVTGKGVVKKVYKREEIFSGAYFKEGKVNFNFYGLDGKPISAERYTEGFADLYLGFYPGYRVSWQTSLGGLEDEVIVPNEQKWSGDHVSVDPSEVQGVFLCNRKCGEGNPRVEDIVPTILSLFGIDVPEQMDGKPLKLQP